MTDWLADWLDDWLNDWLADLLANWLTDWMTYWLNEWLTDWLTDWQSDWLTGLLTDWLAYWLIDWLTDCLTGWLTDWLTAWLSHWLTGGGGLVTHWSHEIWITNPHAFSKRINWHILIWGQSIFPLGINLLILVPFSLDYVLLLLRENMIVTADTKMVNCLSPEIFFCSM